MGARPLRWQLAHPAHSTLHGYAGRWLVGQVVTYDGVRWAAMVRHVRVDDRWHPSAEGAMAAVDAAWTPTAEMVRRLRLRSPR